MITQLLRLASWLLFGLLFVACSADVTPVMPPPTEILTPLSTPVASTVTPASAVTQTSTPHPTDTLVGATPTPTEIPTQLAPTAAVPGDWRVPVVNVPVSIGQEYDSPAWANLNYLLNWEGDTYQFINPLTGQIEATATPTSTPAWGGETVSLSKQFEVICLPDGVKMVRLSDQQVVAEAQLLMDCYLNINWASDGSAAAMITQRGEVYIWRPDGSQPVKIAEGTNYSAPMWSPDNTRILFLAPVPDNLDAEIAGLQIVARDGRPQFPNGAQVEAGNHWDPNSSLIWETNTTLRSRRCGIDYCHCDYYDASTGRFIIRSIKDEMNGREPSISPNGRWLVIEADPRAVIWEQRWEILYSPEDGNPGLLVVDLQTLRLNQIVNSNLPGINGENPNVMVGSDSLKFLGWNADGTRFNLIHFPFGSLEYDLPVGLLALYPNNGHIEPVLPEVAYGLAGPDGKHVFLVTADLIDVHRSTGLKAGIYDLDGTPVTALQPVAEQLEYSTLNEVDVYSSETTRLISSEWSPDGGRVVFTDAGGNLWMMDTAGNTTQLAANLPEASWDGRATFSWSPDGRFLLIRSEKHAWIADISAEQR